MIDVKSLNAWLQEYGYTWVEGQEYMFYGNITASEAQAMINQLYAEGALRHARG